MYDLQLPIALVTTLILTLGTYASYKTFNKGAVPISKYIFLFFLVTLFTQLVGLVQLLFWDMLTSVDSRAWLIVSYANFALIRVAYAILAFGCYVSTRGDTKM